MQPLAAIFFLGGIALIITGANGSKPLIIVGIAMILLAVLGTLARRRKNIR